MKFLKECVSLSQELAKNPSVVKFDIVGSGVYLEDPKDLDVLVLIQRVEQEFSMTVDAMNWWPEDYQNWTNCGGEYDDQNGLWRAIKFGVKNILVTHDEGWYSRMVVASNVCAALKLQDKGDRIVVHRVVRDGYSPEEANQRRNGAT